MKKTFLSVIILFSLFASAQNTWVRKLSYNTTENGYFDSITGIRQIELAPDGSIYLTASITQRNQQQLIKLFPNSNQVEWNIPLGYHHAAGPDWVERFCVTADSGLLLCRNDSYLTGPTVGYIYKYSKDGVVEWYHGIGTSFSDWSHTAYDVIEKNPYEHYVLVEDSMCLFDNLGNKLDSTALISGTRFLRMVNGDFLVLTHSDTLERVDTLGNVYWSYPCTGPFAYDTNYVYIGSPSTYVKKVDAISGNIIWSKGFYNSPISDIDATHDGGFIASVGTKPHGPNGYWYGLVAPGCIFRADSLGDTLWTRIFNLPRYGLSSLKLVGNGNILTGGAYMSGGADYPTGKNYSAFMCMMNSDASYPLAQTEYVAPPDANNDHFRNFVDDALATMLALGRTGIPVDSSLDGHGPWSGYFACGKVNIAIDWATSTGGINDKYSDADGNGVIDTNDVNVFNYDPWCEDSIPLYYRLKNPNYTQSVEQFSFVPVEDTILPGEFPEYYLIIGSDSNPVDSIYGFAVSYFISEYFENNVDSSNFYSTGLGTPGLDLFKNHGIGYVTSQFERQHTLLCRTDFQNAINVNDTVGFIRFGGWFSSANIQLTIADFKAILFDGTEIPFGVSTGSIFIDSSSVKVDERNFSSIKVYPNPADQELKIKNGKLKIGSANVSIFNLMGEEVKTISLTESNQSISVVDLPDGFYTGRFFSDSVTKSFSFMVQH